MINHREKKGGKKNKKTTINIMNQQVYNFLKAEAQADKAKALASLHLLTNHPSGTGGHSTKDYWANCDEAIRLLASSDERIETLEKYFNPQTKVEEKQKNS